MLLTAHAAVGRTPARNESTACASSKTFPMDFLLDRSRPHHSLRCCPDGFGDHMRMDRKFPRLQSRRRLSASMHHQRTGLWSAPLHSRSIRLADARHYSWRCFRIHCLADCSHSASGKVAKAIRVECSSSNSPSACPDMKRYQIGRIAGDAVSIRKQAAANVSGYSFCG